MPVIADETDEVHQDVYLAFIDRPADVGVGPSPVTQQIHKDVGAILCLAALCLCVTTVVAINSKRPGMEPSTVVSLQ